MANRILVVDDNSDIRENICEYLNLRGHQTIGASDAASAAQLIAEEDIALIVLDVGLPGEDGMSFCRRLRLAGSSMLILMLTARDAVDDRVAGLDTLRRNWRLQSRETQRPKIFKKMQISNWKAAYSKRFTP